MVKIGLIPAAGQGTRMRPLTYATPKELLHVHGKPVIEYVLENLKEAGIKKLFIVITSGKEPIMNFLKDGSEFGLDISYLFQNKQKGLAHAINVGKNFIDEDFMVALGDDIIRPNNSFKKLLDYHKEKKSDITISHKKVPKEKVKKYGILETNSENKVKRIIEKPDPNKTDSRKAVVGGYIFPKEVFEYIEKTKKGKKGEYQITDTIQLMIDDKKNTFTKEMGEWIPVGNVKELRKANEHFLK